MTRVYFVRHAEPNYENHNDAMRELSPKGMEDRKMVTSFFADKEIHAALSSPYKRAVDTIKDYTDSAGLEIITIDDFRERKIDSVWIDDFNAFSKMQWADFSYKLSDGECLAEVQERNIRALKQVVTDYAGKHVIIGSHGTAMSTILNYYDPDFGYEDFERIRRKMPWIVELDFDEDGNPAYIAQYDLIACK